MPQISALDLIRQPDRDFTFSDDDMAATGKLARPDGRLVSPPGLAPARD